MHKKSIAFLFALSFSTNLPALACSCENRTSFDDLSQQAATAARRLPSETDRLLARDFRKQGMPIDAAQYFRSASTKATAEAETARTGISTAADLQQTALHSASVHREVSSFFLQQGDAATAATNWEAAINDELLAHKSNRDLGTEYGTVARLYEQAGNPSKAADLWKKQADTLSATHGRYDADVQFALSEYNRLMKKKLAARL